MPQHFTATDGARLAYRDEGIGLPVLCLAGLTRNMADFDDALPALAGVRVIRMDYRGRGDSDWTGAASYTVPQEAADALALLDHLGIEQAAILGTSRGGLIGMLLAAIAKPRLLGLCLNDIGPEIVRSGLERIKDYVGRRPAARTLAEVAEKLPANSPGFEGVSAAQWQAMADRLYRQGEGRVELRYDPALRESVLASFAVPPTDLWPLWAATAGLPVALIRGANSDLLTPDTVARMQDMRPDLIFTDVPDRAHVPFLDEPEAVAVLRRWLEQME
ncbi:alpha/beta fold hydrolase [Fuscovulum blasticum]|uniref:alpha/beta fold hydrolase n=1 Tax=Fuscovulum blasticum TaxID=1075 RepID=UPI000D3EB114|nr:alpha/beta hydrolase [Fuscovulum blasticum]AWD23539.1 alpha/beta hydrolase [Fuscovulum blasticum]